jgi:hypothetical protein
MTRMETLVTQRASVLCAFCRGTGREPFGIMSALSTCRVCRVTNLGGAVANVWQICLRNYR